ncbi:hypothetical protein D3867_06975 [Azospirillum argentinense]|uniref:Uncharacterized protein n=1 Tax=Azospirillum brasilense TaxID=192 RepID=A0A4D8PV81_AZOBR|nr:hypothetical protein D3867_06975 [Azospirillum argentinense]
MQPLSLSRPGRGWPEGPGEGPARIKRLPLAGTLTLPPLRGGPLPLPGRERGQSASAVQVRPIVSAVLAMADRQVPARSGGIETAKRMV